MQLKQKIKTKINRLMLLPIWVKILVSAVILILFIFLEMFMQIKPVAFSYESETCVRQIILFPSFNKIVGNDYGFEVKTNDVVKIGNLEIMSLKTCFKAKKPPSPGGSVISFAPFGGWIGQKTFKVLIPETPLVKGSTLSDPISTIRPLKLLLNSNDLIFDYQIWANEKVADCSAKDSAIYCDVATLNLLQDRVYKIKLVRLFDQKIVETIFEKNIKTLSATNVVSSSVKQDQIIYDNSKVFTFGFDKDVLKTTIEINKLDGEKRFLIASSVKIEKNKAILTVGNDLDRDYGYEFTINKLEAKDGSTLPSPYKLSFKMSDGPSVTNINVGNYGLSTTKTIVLTFDQDLANNTDITKFVSTVGIETSISMLKNQVYIKYTNAPMCTDLSINVKAGLTSNIGVIQSDEWSFSTRTVCHTTSTIGYSVLGRPIHAHTFGSGDTSVLFTGGIHGSEPSGSYIMYDWISYLEINAKKIPANRKIVIVPEANPDGIATLSRYNSNNVNIDRNFPSSNWSADIDTSSGILIGGGGQSPSSEPETKALLDLTASLRPRLIVSFHASGRLVGANQVGDSTAIGNQYASSVGYGVMTGQAEAIMGYSITGEYEDWAGEQYNIPAILIELPTAGGRYFWAHQSTLWNLISI